MLVSAGTIFGFGGGLDGSMDRNGGWQWGGNLELPCIGHLVSCSLHIFLCFYVL